MGLKCLTPTLGGAKPPLFFFIVIPLGGTPQLSICAAVPRAFGIPLLLELEWELTGFPKCISRQSKNL